MGKRITSTSKCAAVAAKSRVKQQRAATLESIFIDMVNAAKGNRRKVPYGYVSGVVSAVPWLSRSIVNKCYMKYKKGAWNEAPVGAHVLVSNIVTVTSDLSDSQHCTLGTVGTGYW